jgi:hypothetical protein
MSLRSLFGWGIVIYAVLYLVWSGMVIHGYTGMFISRVVIIATLVTLASIATRSLRLTHERDVLPYAFGWVVIAAALDAVFSVPSVGWAMYTDWNVWVGYFLLLIVPLVVTAVSKNRPTA